MCTMYIYIFISINRNDFIKNKKNIIQRNLNNLKSQKLFMIVYNIIGTFNNL